MVKQVNVNKRLILFCRKKEEEENFNLWKVNKYVGFVKRCEVIRGVRRGKRDPVGALLTPQLFTLCCCCRVKAPVSRSESDVSCGDGRERGADDERGWGGGSTSSTSSSCPPWSWWGSSGHSWGANATRGDRWSGWLLLQTLQEEMHVCGKFFLLIFYYMIFPVMIEIFPVMIEIYPPK